MNSDFIYMGLLELQGARIENYKMQNSCLQWDSNPVPPTYEANALTIALRDLISIELLKVYRLLSVLFTFTCST